jgi:hypothetical protein
MVGDSNIETPFEKTKTIAEYPKTVAWKIAESPANQEKEGYSERDHYKNNKPEECQYLSQTCCIRF